VKRLAAWLLAAVSLPALATSVMVMSLTGSRVELLVDNRAVRTLRAGESSPEGVRLVEIRDGAALLEFDGRRPQAGARRAAGERARGRGPGVRRGGDGKRGGRAAYRIARYDFSQRAGNAAQRPYPDSHPPALIK